MAIAKFICFNTCWVYFREFYLIFWGYTYYTASSAKCILFYSSCDCAINYNGISIEAGSCNASVKLTTKLIFLLRIKVVLSSNEVNNWKAVIQLYFGEYVLIGECFLPIIVYFNQFSKFSCWEKEIITFPQVIFWFLLRHE